MLPNWANRTLWTGDNLDIMRGMNSETVDLIYLDPPFNSNKNYSAPIGSEAARRSRTPGPSQTLTRLGTARSPTGSPRFTDHRGLCHGKGMQS